MEGATLSEAPLPGNSQFLPRLSHQTPGESRISSPSPKRAHDEMDDSRSMSNSTLQTPQRPSSPAQSTISSSITSLSATPPPPPSVGLSNQSNAPPAKRRKLTEVEKAAREQQRVEKQRLRAEQKAKKEEEKVKRDEDRLVKDEERRQKNEAKEEKKREKELKKQQEEEEKAKKERAQSRINAFFVKPKPVGSKDTSAVGSPNCNSVTKSIDDDKANARQGSPLQLHLSDYRKAFLPFEAPSNSKVASDNLFLWDSEATELAKKEADIWFNTGEMKPYSSLSNCLDLSPYEKLPRGVDQAVTSRWVERFLQTDSSTYAKVTAKEADRPSVLSQKYIFFHQDVRPPYIGTRTQHGTRLEAAKLARNPYKRLHEDVDYEYDSEAEWEPPADDDEDLETEDEELESNGEGEDLAGFLDDEDAGDELKSKSAALYNDMQPLSTGLCWEGDQNTTNAEPNNLAVNFKELRMESLLELHDFPLDPLSTKYWIETTTTAAKPTENKAESSRVPLAARPNPAANFFNAMNQGSPMTTTTTTTTKMSKATKSVRLLKGEELETFKEIVNGSDLTKQGVLAVVKKRLPKVPNAVLSDTLGTYAARVGAKEADKRWIFINA